MLYALMHGRKVPEEWQRLNFVAVDLPWTVPDIHHMPAQVDAGQWLLYPVALMAKSPIMMHAGAEDFACQHPRTRILPSTLVAPSWW
jgi:hypothetical protein